MSEDTLQALMEAIGKQEGFGVPGARPTRNCNPGDLKALFGRCWYGQIGFDSEGFVIFDSPVNGWRALGMDITNHARKNPGQSLAGFIAQFAPSSENNTAAYIHAVASALAVDPVTTLLIDLV